MIKNTNALEFVCREFKEEELPILTKEVWIRKMEEYNSLNNPSLPIDTIEVLPDKIRRALTTAVVALHEDINIVYNLKQILRDIICLIIEIDFRYVDKVLVESLFHYLYNVSETKRKS